MIYTDFHITYHVTGNPDDSAKMLKAVRMSQETYCGVSFMMKKIAPVTWQIILNGIPLNADSADNNEPGLLHGWIKNFIFVRSFRKRYYIKISIKFYYHFNIIN